LSATALVLGLDQVGRHDLATAGGKGANLGELVQGRFPVPAGFVLTTAAYDRVAAHNGLAAADPAAMQAAFEGAIIPAEVEDACRAAYERLGRGAVAVRSSATAEDLPQAAFAGQQETFLNVEGIEQVLQAVRRCWASLWSERAVAYRAQAGMGQQPVKLAVVLQRMVDADVAGVLFSANPVTGDRRDMVIDASPGLGEAVVSGLATPDHYVLRRGRRGWRVVERRIGKREVVVRSRFGGGTEQVMAGAAATATSVLSDGMLRRLARAGAAIERTFGTPQDVEWAYQGNRLFILQARPITALPEAGRSLPPLAAGILGEVMALRPYPFDVSAWLPAVVRAIAPLIELFGVAVPPVERLMVLEDSVAVRLNGRLVRPTPAVLLAAVRLARLGRRYDPTRWQADPALLTALERARALAKRDVTSASWAELVAMLDEALRLPEALAGDVRRRYFPRAMLALGVLVVMLRLAGQAKRLGVLLSGIETETVAANRRLEGLAAEVRANPALAELFDHAGDGVWARLEGDDEGRRWLAELQGFLERYGHREQVLATASLATWGEEPEIVLGIITGLAQEQHRPRPEAATPAWQSARAEVLYSVPVRQLRAPFIRVLDTARRLLQIREDTHFHATLALPPVRHAILEMGRRLVAAGALASEGDVFHLTLRELQRPPLPADAPVVRALVKRRRARRAELEGIPIVKLGAGAALRAETGVLVYGSAGSRGIAEGPVRVIRSSAEFGLLRPGEVLVAPFTNPSWTPLFQRAAAVVVDAGGAGSHAAIVAREYGIPAVMGTGDATRRLKDGQVVQVDGGRGIVTEAGQAA
jgi:pyruvate,water dikinase